MRIFDYMFSYVSSRAIYDYIQNFINANDIPFNVFVLVVIVVLVLYITLSRR